jgi:hypothetical protein
MERLTLNEATKELERLENEKNYWENRLEQILSLTMPHSMDIQNERVDGGVKIDKLLRYTELKDDLDIDIKLKYINDKIDSLNEWIQGELTRLDKYGETDKTIVYLREHKMVRDKYTNRMRKMTWQEIANETHYSERAVRLFYKKSVKERENDNKKTI